MRDEPQLCDRGKGWAPDASGQPHAAFRAGRIHGQRRLDGWVNKLIFEDNLGVLGRLRRDRDVAAKVRLIYIDPPFSTNQTYRAGRARTATVSSSNGDSLAYQDLLVGREYLEFMRQRLVLLRELLAEDGSIYVHIDCKMGHYVKVLMDEVFGQDRFINDIARVKCNPKNFERRGFGNFRDMVLLYSKTASCVWNESREDMSDEDTKRLFPKVDPEGRRYTTTPLHAPGETTNGGTGGAWKGLLPPPGRHWRYRPEELRRLDQRGLVEWSSTGNPRKKIYAEDVLRAGKKRQDVWDFKDPAYPLYPTQKNLKMLETIVLASSNPDDLVLDAFAGAGSALVAAEIQGRRWIGIDNSRVAIRVAARRLTELRNVRAFQILRGVKRSGHEPVDSP